MKWYITIEMHHICCHVAHCNAGWFTHADTKHGIDLFATSVQVLFGYNYVPHNTQWLDEICWRRVEQHPFVRIQSILSRRKALEIEWFISYHITIEISCLLIKYWRGYPNSATWLSFKSNIMLLCYASWWLVLVASKYRWFEVNRQFVYNELSAFAFR